MEKMRRVVKKDGTRKVFKIHTSPMAVTPVAKKAREAASTLNIWGETGLCCSAGCFF